ncbi:MAG: carotenoid biosynthesis protein [Crocinitomicaceae bacterium]|nr:carotenoid biosynthesis protein [Crocinitomicaceae bacterium]
MARSSVRSNKGIQLIIGILILFHAIGVGIMLLYPEGAKLSYLNLILAAFLLFLSEKNYIRTAGTFVIILAGGFLVEYIGVHTGLLFGNYEYGAALGPKIGEIPLVIGVNWFCIVVASSALLYSFRINIVLKAILAGALCTGMDFLIEPVAIKLDFWDWENGVIPIWNYVCWFGFSTFFSFIYYSLGKSRNKPAQALYFIWVLFFSILNFAL